MALGAGGLAAITGLHHAILYLVEVVGHHLEEVVDAIKHRWIAMPQQVFLLLSELIIRSVYRKRLAIAQRHFVATCYEFVLPFRHLFSAPAHHGIFHERERLVGNDKVFVDAHHLAKAFAFRTSTSRRVEVEHHVRRLFECHSVGFEALREQLLLDTSIRQPCF